MELRQLKHFVAVVECGNLSAAAKRVLISQPGLTRSIMNLEEDLRTKLLERLPRGVAPTPAGKAFFRDAKFMLSECAHVRDKVQSFATGKIGSVAIGVVPLFATHILPTVLKQLADVMPMVDVSVTEGLNPELNDQLLEGSLDLLFTTLLPAKLPRGLTSERLCEVSSIVAIGTSHPLAKKRSLGGKDLGDTPWVLVQQGRGSAVGDYIVEQYMTQNGLPPPQTVLHTNSLSLVKELILHHGFASMLPDHMVAREIAGGQVKPIPMPSGPFHRPAGLIYREVNGPRPVIDRVLDVVRTAARAA